MIDIHNHVLPGVDDGARDEGVMQGMLLRARDLGFTTVVATPHLPGPLDGVYADRVRRAAEAASSAGQTTGVTVQQGFEVVLSADLPRRLADGEPLTLGDSNAVLIELPLMGWATGTEATLFGLQMDGYRVVVAHPERYDAVQDDPGLALQLAERGVILQVTLTSLVGIAGKAAQRTAETLIRQGAVQIAATDAHSTGRRYALVPEGIERLTRLVGPEGVRVMLEVAPSALLTNQSLPAVPAAPASRERRPWFMRLRPGAGRG
jgi:protein-tyrosine phosphatase